MPQNVDLGPIEQAYVNAVIEHIRNPDDTDAARRRDRLFELLLLAANQERLLSKRRRP